MSNAKPLTLTEARKQANSILRWGHFRPSATQAYARCKERHEVHVEFVPWTKDGEIHQRLREALAEHLREECGA